MKKIVALMLCLAMLPASAFAEDFIPAPPSWENDHAAVCENREDAAAFEITDGCSVISLDGEWRFMLSQNPAASPDVTKADTSAWDTITVPSNWERQGFGYPICSPYDYPWAESDDTREKRAPQNANPVGSYVREFTYDGGSDRVYAVFEGAASCVFVYINGKYVGYGEDSNATHRFDITDCVKRGENTIAAQVYRFCDGSYSEVRDDYALSGLYRSVYILCTPEDYEKDSAPADLPKVELKDGLYVDGEKTVLKGVIYDAFDPETGDAITEDQIRRDIALMKELGINAIRTRGSYPEKLLDVCDEEDIYVVAEANFIVYDAPPQGGGFGGGWGRRNVEVDYSAEALDRVKNMYARDKSHPCVVIWSLTSGGETGAAYKAMYDYLKSVDSRPVYCSVNDQYSDFTDASYLSSDEIFDLANSTKCVLSGEFAEFLGNAGGGIAEYREIFDSCDNFAGGFADCFADNLLWTKREVCDFTAKDLASGKTYSGSGSLANVNGETLLLDAQIETGLELALPYTLLFEFFPVDTDSQVLASDVSQAVVASDGYLGYWGDGSGYGNIGQTGSLTRAAAVVYDNQVSLFSGNSFKENIDAAPSDLQDLIIGGQSSYIKSFCAYDRALDLDELIEGTNGAVLELSFDGIVRGEDYSYYYLGTGSDLSSDGDVRGLFSADREMYYAANELAYVYGRGSEDGEVEKPAYQSADGEVDVLESAGGVTLSANGSAFTFDAESGCLTAFEKDGGTVFDSPLELSFFRVPTDIDQEYYYYESWLYAYPQLTDFKVKENTVHAVYRIDGFDAFADVFYTVTPSGELRVEMSARIGGNAPDINEIGMRFDAYGFYRIKWTGNGPFPSYPDRKASVGLGEWESSIAELYEKHPNPQDTTNLTDVCRAEITGEKSIVITGDALDINVSPYSIEEIYYAASNHDLAEESARAAVRVIAKEAGLAPENAIKKGKKYAVTFTLSTVGDSLDYPVTALVDASGEKIGSFTPSVHDYVCFGEKQTITPILSGGSYTAAEKDGMYEITTDGDEVYRVHFTKGTEYLGDSLDDKKAFVDSDAFGGTINLREGWWSEKTFDKGVSAAANSTLTFDLSKYKNSTLEFSAGFDSDVLGNSFSRGRFDQAPTKFAAYLDGEKVWERETGMFDPFETVTLDISSARELRLEASGGESSVTWADLRVMPKGARLIYSNADERGAVAVLTNGDGSKDVNAIITAVSRDESGRIANLRSNGASVPAGFGFAIYLDGYGENDEVYLYETSLGEIRLR